jgi:hypothetical protein
VTLNAALRGVMDEDGFTAIAERVGEQLRHELFSVTAWSTRQEAQGED